MSDAGAQPGKRRPADEPGFDEILDRLRAVVERLEGGKLTLEESLSAYEEGVSLARRGHALLDRAEKRVELLVRSGPAGVEVEPLDPEQAEDDESRTADADGAAGNGDDE